MTINEALKGKTICEADVDGDGIVLIFDDNTAFEYLATDGGYSSYKLHDKVPSWWRSDEFFEGAE